MTSMIRFVVLLTVLALGGCATTASNPKDPFEGFNRTMHSFNDTVDKAALKPVATLYQTIVPDFLQRAVGNFFGNLGDVWTAVNNLLQGKVHNGVSDVTRVFVNSTLGVAGLIDVASHAGLVKHKEDFGQTLGVWGVKSGPYLVLPLLGPSTVRDTAALPLDFKGDLWSYYHPVDVRNSGIALRLIDQRAVLLDAGNMLEAAALDPYEFTRDAYLQHRQSKITDGKSSEVDAEPEPAKAKSDDKSSSLNQDVLPLAVDSGAVVATDTNSTDSVSLPMSALAASGPRQFEIHAFAVAR